MKLAYLYYGFGQWTSASLSNNQYFLSICLKRYACIITCQKMCFQYSIQLFVGVLRKYCENILRSSDRSFVGILTLVIYISIYQAMAIKKIVKRTNILTEDS